MADRLYKIVRGRVVNIKEYGAFVSIEDSSKQGLLHRTQISNHAFDKVDDVLEVGEYIYCKIISTEDDRIALSMKLVDQTTGRDKDPNNLIASKADERRRKRNTGDSHTPIHLGAVYDTVCRKCGIRGHLASSCFSRHEFGSLGLVYSSSSDEEHVKRSNDKERHKHNKRKHDMTNVEDRSEKKSRTVHGREEDGRDRKSKIGNPRGHHHRERTPVQKMKHSEKKNSKHF